MDYQNPTEAEVAAATAVNVGLVRCASCGLYVEPMLANPSYDWDEEASEVDVTWICDDCHASK